MAAEITLLGLMVSLRVWSPYATHAHQDRDGIVTLKDGSCPCQRSRLLPDRWLAQGLLDTFCPGKTASDWATATVTRELWWQTRAYRRHLPRLGWTVWYGGTCPIPKWVDHQVLLRNGQTYEDADAPTWSWSVTGEPDDIVGYRLLSKEEVYHVG